MHRVVFDTNVYISAFLTKNGRAEEAYLLAVRKKFQLYTSVPIITEMASKLRTKFSWDDEAIKKAVRHVSSVATVVKPTIKLDILQDEPDNRILECAKAAKADFIVTGDKHLLILKEFKGSGIVTIAEFLNRYGLKGIKAGN